MKFASVALSALAISLAISRDGSSGGVIRTCTINENGQEKKYTPGDKLPEFFNQ